MNYKNKEKFIAHAIFLTGTILVLYPFFSILFLALSEPGKRISGFTLPSGIYFDNFIKAWVGGSFDTGLLNSFIIVVFVLLSAGIITPIKHLIFYTNQLFDLK